MDGEDDLDILTALLEESENVCPEQTDDLDDLFDEDDDDEEYKDSIEEKELASGDVVKELFGNVDDIENEKIQEAEEVCENPNKSNEDLQEELRKMQEQVKKLQEQLQASSSSGEINPKETVCLKPITKKQAPTKKLPSKPTQAKQKAKQEAVSGGTFKLQESSDFSSQLNLADSFKQKPKVANQSKTDSPPEGKGPAMEIRIGSSFLPLDNKTSEISRSPSSSTSRAATAPTKPPVVHPPLPKDVSVEKYSGLRLRKPRVSSCEMDRKMADRRLIRLSQVPERLTREKLEESDWVTFGVVINKATPQSSNSGKTFSIWKLSDLHNLEVFVSLLLFGEVHREHWKTETGTVIGILNPNPMKPKEGYDGVSLTVDHPQKLLKLGEAQDYGTCKAMKKNGDLCTQIVNMYECQYCQYHVKAQYKKMSSKRAELQSSYSGKAPNKLKGNNLRERLCQDGFHYGGLSSAACATSLAPSKPTKPVQKTLDKLFVKGSAQLLNQANKLAMQSGEVSGCSDEFKDLMSMPTPGALQLKKHLVHGNHSGSKDATKAPLQSISASDLLKQQKRMQRELLESRRQRQNASGVPPNPQCSLVSPKATRSPAVPHAPTLGRGFSKGDDILFFDNRRPPAPSPSVSAAKMAAMKKLRSKRAGFEKEDPNAVKRKRSDPNEIRARVEKNLTSPNGEASSNEEEPAQKKKRDQLSYIQSEEFQKILNAKSRHSAVLQAAEYQLQERYFDVLVKKEQMEEKMKGIREMKCRAVSCIKCNYTYFKPADRCVNEHHDLRWHDAVKRFFKCSCGQRAIALDRLPHKHCGNCGLFKWERDGMMKEKSGPKIGGELLQTRGEEHAKFLNSMM